MSERELALLYQRYDQLIQDYLGINNVILWNSVSADIPELLPQLQAL
jgi:uncharacterized protein with HEPN domain